MFSTLLRNLTKKFVLNVMLALASFFVGLFFCEIAVRIFSPQQLIDYHQNIWRPDDQLGYRHRENANTVINNGEGPHRFVTDQYGYRINSPTPTDFSNSNYGLSILNIGDSFLEAVSVDNAETIPQILARRLQEDYGKNIFAANPSTSGWNVNHYYLEAKRSLSVLHFDLAIVFLFIGNYIVAYKDTTVKTPLGSVRIRAANRKEALNRWRREFSWMLEKWLEANSQLFIFVKQHAYMYFSKIGIITRKDPKEFFTSELASPRWQITAEICADIRNECESQRTTVIFVLIPPIYQVQENLFYDYAHFHNLPDSSFDLDQPNRLLALEFSKRSLVLADPLRFLRQEADKGRRLYGRVDRHLNPAGHHAVAEFLLPVVEECLEPVLVEKP